MGRRKGITVKYWPKREKWVVRYHEAEAVKHSMFDSQAAANAEASRLRDQVNRTGHVWNSLTAAQRESVISAWSASRLGKTGPSPTLGSTIGEVVLSKQEAGRSKRYTDNLKIILDQFAIGRSARPIDEITVADVDAFLNCKSVASWSTLRARLSTLFKYAIRRGYRMDNPCGRLEPVTAPHKPPAIFTVEQAEKCLAFFRTPQKLGKYSRVVDYSYAMPWFVLSTFCGLRPEEADHITRKHIHAKEGWIRVEISKIRQRRVVYPLAPAMDLLKQALKRGKLPLTRQRRRRVIRRLRAHLGWKEWPKDVTRHSAASYWLAECGSAATVAEALGHSESVLKRNYKAIVTRAEAEKFWALCGQTSVKHRIPKVTQPCHKNTPHG